MLGIRKILLNVLLLSLAIQSSIGQDYRLVWKDEFTGNHLDTSTWRFEVRGNNYNNELQYYTDRIENLEVKDGYLNIIALKEQYLGKDYTSARINTNGNFNFKYGKIEARMKMPHGQGMWPALWLLGSNIGSEGWPDCGEIDIMEMIGGDGRENTVHSTIHWGPFNDGDHPYTGQAYKLPSGTFSDDYHIITTEWNNEKVKSYCDGNLFFTIDISTDGMEAFHDQFFIIINLAVGGDWPGSPDTTTVFPQAFKIDYIRLYQMNEERRKK